jgi:molybdenum cofactor cytidylyltransferase
LFAHAERQSAVDSQPIQKPLAALILSGGESRRMGSPKALLPYRGTTFVEHLIDATRHPRVGITRIVVGAHAEQISKKLGDYTASIVLNENWQQGQLSSLQTAMRSIPAGSTSGIIVCPVDHPIVSAALVAQLIEEFYSSGKPIVVPVFQGRRGHPMIFGAPLYDELLAASAEIGARQVVWAHSADVVEVPTEEEGVALNLNDPETFKRVVEDV